MSRLPDIELKELEEILSLPEQYRGKMVKEDYVGINFGGRYVKVLSSCPNCGELSFSSTHKIGKKDNEITLTPSLIFNCCGWHGYLTDGKFIKA